uniref:Carbohydrate kinase PfkB domain-containing protein n=1 Tax=Streptomyces fradiae TaxID=1906 RepID=Q938W6_STRFR|nr:unknown [Streptomyces fradiae]
MRIAVTGSIATDHLMAFPGRFGDQLIPDQLARVSLSFLVDGLEVRRGGVAVGIAFGLGRPGPTPLLVGAVGNDFADYGTWPKEHGVDTGGVLVPTEHQTARFLCITDRDANQIAASYTGAMREARDIGLRRTGALPAPRHGLVLICPDDPAAMVRHTAQCREPGLPFVADPSQQLARLETDEVRALVHGAHWVFTNEYEAALLLEHSGWKHSETLERVGAWVTTLGGAGVRIERAGEPPLTVPAVPDVPVVDPTGIGAAFRAGFLAGAGRGLSIVSAARLGCVLAARALGTVGPADLPDRSGGSARHGEGRVRRGRGGAARPRAGRPHMTRPCPGSRREPPAGRPARAAAVIRRPGAGGPTAGGCR